MKDSSFSIYGEIAYIYSMWLKNDPELLNEGRWTKDQFERLLDSEEFRLHFPEEKITAKFKKILNAIPGEKPMHACCMLVKLKEQKLVRHKQVEQVLENGMSITTVEAETSESSIDTSAYSVCVLTDESIKTDTAYFNTQNTAGEERLYSMLDLLYKPYHLDLSLPDDIMREMTEEGTDVMREASIKLCDSQAERSEDKTYGYYECAACMPARYYVEIEWGRRIGIRLHEEEFPEFDGDSREMYNEMNRRLDILFASLEPYLENAREVTQEELKKEFDEIFLNSGTNRIRALSVGQANAVLITNDNGLFAFDYGLCNSELTEKGDKKIDDAAIGYRNGDQELWRNNPKKIIISHWHSDHYLGLFSLDRKFYKGRNAGRVIAPMSRTETSFVEKRLVAYLLKNNMLTCLEAVHGSFRRAYRGKDCKAYMVRCPRPVGKNYDMNNDCVVLQIGHTLLTGDCDYSRWPEQYGLINGEAAVTNIIVPHHGSLKDFGNAPEEGRPDPRKPKLIDFMQSRLNANRGKAIFCVGFNNTNLPDEDAVDAFREMGFEVFKTNDEGIAHEDLTIVENLG